MKHVSNKTIVKALKLGQALGSIYAPLAQVKIKICILRINFFLIGDGFAIELLPRNDEQRFKSESSKIKIRFTRI